VLDGGEKRFVEADIRGEEQGETALAEGFFRAEAEWQQ